MSERQSLNRKNAGIKDSFPERVVQFGAGNFIRAFVDWMIQELNEKTNFASSVVVVKVTPGRYDTLDEQDGLFHVHIEGIQNGEFVSQTQLISCINRTVYPYQDYNAYMALARRPEIRFLLSNTTESGISYNENNAFDDSPASSFPAKLTQFLYERYRHFEGVADKGCIIIPTELVVDNGSQLREMILRYASQWRLDKGFSDWIEQHNIFCNTLVDRIVPGYPAADSEAIQEKIGFEDQLLAMGEPYFSWIIEAPDSIKAELPVENVVQGVRIVDDASPYRLTKVRILNGLHTSMVPIGYLMGLETVRESVEHPLLGQFLQDEARKDIIPSLDLPVEELEQFTRDVFDRFLNPSVHHRLMSIATNSGAKIKTRILPTLLAYHDKYGGLPHRIVLAFAAFIRFYKGEWRGRTIELNDDTAVVSWFADQWENCGSLDELVSVILQNESLWGYDLSRINGLQKQLADYLKQIDESGIVSIIEQLNG